MIRNRWLLYGAALLALAILIYWAATDCAGAAPLAAGVTVRATVRIDATVHVYPEADATHAGISWRCGNGQWRPTRDNGFRPRCRGILTIRSASTYFDYAVLYPGETE